MTTTPKILAFAGSLRTESLNKKLVQLAIPAAEQAGAEVTCIDLKDFPLPVFDEDIETAEGHPEAAKKLKDLFRAHDGLLISAPEYNSSISGALKNTIDWISRPEEGRPPLDCFDGKVAGLLSAAAGGLGGMRALPHVRAILQNIKVIVLPQMVGIPAAHDAFNEDGTLKNEQQQKMVEGVGKALAETLIRLKT
ncbi:MAG: NAD(P)H-dependent oxidoreductase [Planctomycetota bacterium]|nr:NAD(P)H-dependent oxidoreductase [Planctomycetota bacterium]